MDAWILPNDSWEGLQQTPVTKSVFKTDGYLVVLIVQTSYCSFSFTFNMRVSGASRGEQASWNPTSWAPWVINFPPMASRPLSSMVVKGSSSWALMAYQPSVSHTTAKGLSTLPSPPGVSALGELPLEATPQTQRTSLLAAVSSLSMIFLRAGLRLWSTSTSYLPHRKHFLIAVLQICKYIRSLSTTKCLHFLKFGWAVWNPKISVNNE